MSGGGLFGRLRWIIKRMAVALEKERALGWIPFRFLKRKDSLDDDEIFGCSGSSLKEGIVSYEIAQRPFSLSLCLSPSYLCCDISFVRSSLVWEI